MQLSCAIFHPAILKSIRRKWHYIYILLQRMHIFGSSGNTSLKMHFLTDKASNKNVIHSGWEFSCSVSRAHAHRENSGTCAKLISEDFKLKVLNIMSLLAFSPEILILYSQLFLSSKCFAAWATKKVRKATVKRERENRKCSHLTCGIFRFLTCLCIKQGKEASKS